MANRAYFNSFFPSQVSCSSRSGYPVFEDRVEVRPISGEA